MKTTTVTAQGTATVEQITPNYITEKINKAQTAMEDPQGLAVWYIQELILDIFNFCNCFPGIEIWTLDFDIYQIAKLWKMKKPKPAKPETVQSLKNYAFYLGWKPLLNEVPKQMKQAIISRQSYQAWQGIEEDCLQQEAHEARAEMN